MEGCDIPVIYKLANMLLLFIMSVHMIEKNHRLTLVLVDAMQKTVVQSQISTLLAEAVQKTKGKQELSEISRQFCAGNF